MEVNEIKLLSVGVDVGSSTSHLAFSNLLLQRDERSATRRFLIKERQVIYEGRIIDTPLLDDQTINIDRLTDFLKAEYARAGIHPDDIQTGAVIVTGEAARKRNAQQIVDVLSKDAGKFVAATAGPNFESVIAALGSAATRRSQETGQTILSCDIGGGTANSAISVNGEIISTSCVAVGGRLLAVNPDGKIWRLAQPVKKVMDHLGLQYEIGDRISKKAVDTIATKLAEVLVEVITRPAESELARMLMVTGDLDFRSGIDAYSFSGGVAELMYGGNGQHKDIGPLLARKIKALMKRLSLSVVEPENKIRATVIGAGAHTLSISGSSGFSDDDLTFPMKNIPVLRVDIEQSRLSEPHVVIEVNRAFKRFDLAEGERVVALYFKDPVRNSYPRLELFAKSIEAALPNSIENKIPIILIFEGDIACSVGNVIRRETDLKTNLLTLDELELKEGDWIDIGKPLVDDQVSPVTVKSLVFHH
jgi:ethanolamine utilization protein EutA